MAATRHAGEAPARVAVITGASRGIGAGLAAALATEGMSLGLCARTTPRPPPGSQALCASVDVTRADQVDAFGREVFERFDRVDLWINNAGILEPIGPLADADPGQVRALLDTNVLGVAHGTACFVRHVRSRPGSGVLVNISSGAAVDPSAGWAAYCASKAAVEMLTEVVALEEADSGLRAYALAPGVVDTDMQALIRSTPAERFPTVERFLRRRDEHRFNSAEWVARYVVDTLIGPEGRSRNGDPGRVRRRVPDQPRTG